MKSTAAQGLDHSATAGGHMLQVSGYPKLVLFFNGKQHQIFRGEPLGRSVIAGQCVHGRLEA